MHIVAIVIIIFIILSVLLSTQLGSKDAEVMHLLQERQELESEIVQLRRSILRGNDRFANHGNVQKLQKKLLQLRIKNDKLKKDIKMEMQRGVRNGKV